MQRLAVMSWATPLFALVGCVGNPAILGVGEEGNGGSEGAGSEQSDGAEDGFSDTGTPGDDDDGDDDGDDSGADTGAEPACAEVDAFGATSAATLTPSQYDDTVRDLTGATGPFAVGQIDAAKVGVFAISMDVGDAAALAPEVAAAIDLHALLPCDPATTDVGEQQQCFDDFVPAFIRLAWRHPVDAVGGAQTAAFAGPGDFATRMRAVIASVLADPEFIVLARTGTPTDGDAELIVLDAHALATRLAMFLWNSGPDAELLDLADTGELLEPGALHAQAERLLADDRAARMVGDFHAQWLAIADVAEVAKDAEVFPEYDAELGADMLTGTKLFARSVVLDGSGRLEDLFTLPTSFANDRLAAIYGVDIIGAVPSGPAFEPVSLDPARRGGLLTEPSFATMHSRPDGLGFTHRGMVIRENLLCQELPPPPPDVNMELPPLPENATHKEQWETVFADPSCQGCHALMDPFSFAFDNYDAIGRWTDEIAEQPIDPSGDTNGFTFANRTELMAQLLASEQLTSCVVNQYVRYALDRLEGPDDACTLESLRDTLVESDGNVRDLVLAVVDSDAFRVARTP